MAVLRVGIVGAGWIGQWHAARWRLLPVTLSGFFDVNSENAARAVQRYGGQAFASLDDLLDTVDVVQICTPTVEHKDACIQAAIRGKHIFCEKPLARHIADAEAIIAACEHHGVRLYVGQVLRFFPQYARAKQLVEDGAIGTPGSIRLLRAATHPAVSEERAWFKSAALTGGCILEGGIHDFDFARWTLGEIERVFARGLTFREDLPIVGDHALVTLRFKSGAVGHVEGSWMVTDGRFRQQFEIAGDGGLLEYDSLPSEQFTLTVRGQSSPALLPVEPLHTADEPYFRQLQHFLDCLLNDREFLVPPSDALEALRLSLSAVESMRRNSPVTVAEVA